MPDPEQDAGRAPPLGQVAFALAALLVVGPLVLAFTVPEATSFAEDEFFLRTPINRVIVGQGVSMLVPLVLGIIAVRTRYGGGWGVAAIVCAVLLNFLLITLLLTLPLRSYNVS